MEYLPSYDNYIQIAQAMLSTGKVKKFTEVTEQDSEFIVVRHDIEFDIEKAAILARIEAGIGLKSTYLVQIGSNAYNAFSDENIERLLEIIDLGHDVGLHYRELYLPKTLQEEEIARQLDALQKLIYGTVKVYGCHRPHGEYSEYNVKGAINTYSEPFFYRTDNPIKAPTRYISDSKWRWNYGDPVYQFFRDVPRVQFLAHPFQWSYAGIGMKETFEGLELSHKVALLNTFADEYERYREI